MGHMVAQMLFAILYTSLGENAPSAPEASLLQVSQAPALQAQPQVSVQVPPPAPPAQVVQPSVAGVPTAAQIAYVGPAAPGAAMTTASAGPVPASVPPAQAALTATASGVKSTQMVQMNETALAFGQLSALNTEFKELHADDASHVRQLMYNVHLREQLQEKLRQAGDQLAEDNEHLAERTMQIIADGDPTQPRKDESLPQGAENPSNETFAALLLEAAVVSRRNRERDNAQIAAQALERVRQLVADIAALRARDEQEIQALRANAESRNALRKKIEERDDQLHEDTNLLMKDLGSIRDLVSKDDANAAGSAMEPPAANPKQDAAQNEAGSNA